MGYNSSANIVYGIFIPNQTYPLDYDKAEELCERYDLPKEGIYFEFGHVGYDGHFSDYVIYTSSPTISAYDSAESVLLADVPYLAIITLSKMAQELNVEEPHWLLYSSTHD